MRPNLLPLIVLLAMALGAAAAAVASALAWPELPSRLHLGAAMMLAIAGVCAVLGWRVHSEDRLARLELALYRERSRSDRAGIALAGSGSLPGRQVAQRGGGEPGAQLMLIRAELAELRRSGTFEGPALEARMELLCARVDRVAQAVCDARSG
jgi:hypothetical protein